MRLKRRQVCAELLDDLPPENSAARRSRRDLRRIHRVMCSAAILRKAVNGLLLTAPPRRILELGAGDGSLLLRLASAIRPPWKGVQATLLDRHELVSDSTRRAYRELNWDVTTICVDAMIWAQAPVVEHYDLCIAVLFLHHFETDQLNALLRAAAARSDAFVSVDPRRDLIGYVASASVGVIGANRITRKDALTSVAAGFRGREISALWQRVPGRWDVAESRALPFLHCFAAVRAPDPAGGGCEH